jgi:hypothetical protein
MGVILKAIPKLCFSYNLSLIQTSYMSAKNKLKSFSPSFTLLFLEVFIGFGTSNAIK